eukprot:CAMPEP_0172592564 /NCGR_PEP_ID=MMETSP1068-20121228/11572_1 /TAXON_ID=35684 /ORGANISM="Pseudopedinella elastica, Strain CCMP716" /LENGTH=386 /DNA_ID=CAMNT_0013389611 /DNA_START=256 /DNA_END=1417 /DNA_ORIENTATION=-
MNTSCFFVAVAIWVEVSSANHASGNGNLLKHANFDAQWLKEALLWNDDIDGKPQSAREIDNGLRLLETRLGISSDLRSNAVQHNFTWQTGSSSWTVKLFTTECDRSIYSLVIDELKNDEYDTAGHPLSSGDIALDIGGHVGAAALQVATQATGADSGVFTFEPTKENYLFNQWNMWANGFYQDRVVVLHTGVAAEERLLDIQYSPHDTTGAGSWRRNFPHAEKSGPCKVSSRYPVRMMAIEAGLVDLGVLGRIGGQGAPRPGRRIAFVKLDCEGCEFPILTRFKPLWQDHVLFVAGEMHYHFAPCRRVAFEAYDALCAGRAAERKMVPSDCMRSGRNNRDCSRLCTKPQLPDDDKDDPCSEHPASLQGHPKGRARMNMDLTTMLGC